MCRNAMRCWCDADCRAKFRQSALNKDGLSGPLPGFERADKVRKGEYATVKAKTGEVAEPSSTQVAAACKGSEKLSTNLRTYRDVRMPCGFSVGRLQVDLSRPEAGDPGTTVPRS